MPSSPAATSEALPDDTCRSRRLALAALIPWGFGLAYVLDESWRRRVDPQDPWILGLMAVLAIGAWCWGRGTPRAAALLDVLSGLVFLAALVAGGLWWLVQGLAIPM